MSREMSHFIQAEDTHKNPIFSFPITATDRLALSANVAKLYTIPANSNFILLISSADIHVLLGDAEVLASIPDEYDVLDGSAPILNPGVICNVAFDHHTHISIISESDCTVSVLRWRR